MPRQSQRIESSPESQPMIAWAKPHPVLQFLQSRSIHLLEKAQRSPQRDPCLCIARIVLDRSFQYLGASLHIAELRQGTAGDGTRSEEHTSELQSLRHLVC